MDHDPQGRADRLTLALVDDQLKEFAWHAAATLGWSSSCSITMDVDGQARRSASSDMFAATCDDVEVDTGAGPCIDAMAHARVVVVDDLRGEERWPAWARTARAAGFLSAAAFPGHSRSGPVVAVNVYRKDFGPWPRDALVRADVYAQQVARVLELCLRVGSLEARRSALQQAVEAQASIDRAIGAVMVTNQCDAATALHILRSGARSRNVELSDVALNVLESLAPEDRSADQG